MKVSNIKTLKLYLIAIEKFTNWLTPERLKLYPPLIPLFFIITWAISQYLGPGLLDGSGTIIGSDFLAFYNAGSFFVSDKMDKLYNFYEQYLFQKSVTAPFPGNGFFPFINPPFSAPFFALFSRSGYLEGLIYWWVVGLLLILFSIGILRNEMKSLKKYSMIKLMIMCFMFPPALIWFIHGQNTPITLFLFTLIFILLRQKYDFTAGILFGFLLYKPQLAIGIGVLILLKKRWHTLLGGCLGASFLLVVGFTTSTQAMHDYFQIFPHLTNIIRLSPNYQVLKTPLFNLVGELNYPSWGLHSFFGFSSLLLDNIWKFGANLLTILLTIGSLTLIFFLWVKKKWDPGTKSWDFRMAATLIISLLVSPHLFTYDLMLLVLPLGIIFSHFPEGTLGKPLDGGALLFWTALIYIGPFCSGLLTNAQLRLFKLIGFPQFAIQLSLFLLLGWTWVVIQESKKRNSPPAVL